MERLTSTAKGAAEGVLQAAGGVRAAMGAAATGKTTAVVKTAFLPIAQLNCYLASWKVKGLVLERSEVRGFNKKDGRKGQVFSCTIQDRSGEISVSFFDEAVEKYFRSVVEGRLVVLAGGTVKAVTEKRRQYATVSHQYELSFDGRGTVEPVGGDDSFGGPRLGAMRPIEAVQDLPLGMLPSCIDLVGIVLEDRGKETFRPRDALEDMTKREVVLAGPLSDPALMRTGRCQGFSFTVALWGEKAEKAYPVGSLVLAQKISSGFIQGVGGIFPSSPCQGSGLLPGRQNFRPPPARGPDTSRVLWTREESRASGGGKPGNGRPLLLFGFSVIVGVAPAAMGFPRSWRRRFRCAPSSTSSPGP